MDFEEGQYTAKKQARFLEHVDLYLALAELPEKQHEAVWMWAEGLTYEEIAEMLGITRQAAHKRIQRAFASMRETLTGDV